MSGPLGPTGPLGSFIIGGILIAWEQAASGTNKSFAINPGYQPVNLNTSQSWGSPGVSTNGSGHLDFTPGTYYINGSVPAFRVNYFRAALTDSTNNPIILGSSEFVGTSSYAPNPQTEAQGRSFVQGIITVGSNVTYRLGLWISASWISNYAGGIAASILSTSEIYSLITIQRII
jgi:hypothetical protein